jgi:plasmid stabilization system protein ParE
MTKLRILPEVFQDTAEAANWYDDRESGLGELFLSCFRSTYNPIKENPFAYRTIYKGYRRVLLHPFPYAVYFRLQNELAIITLVFHTARNPATMRRILRSRENS